MIENDRSLTILLIDDDDVAQESVIRSFKKQGVSFPVVTADDGQEGLDVLRGDHPSKSIDGPLVVLLDLNMPRMNGFEFLQHLRQDRQLAKTVVFILTTSNADHDRAKAYENFISGYMVKSEVGPQFSKLAHLLTEFERAVTLP